MHVCCVYIRNNINCSHELFHYELRYDIIPLGISYISSSLKQCGYTTEMLYCNPINYKESVDIIEKKPDVFAISVVSNSDYDLLEKLVVIFKKKYAEAKIIVGGQHPTLAPNNILLNENIDAICIGAGEVAIAEYVKQVEKGEYKKTDNLWIKNSDGSITKADKVISIEDLDSIPFPDRKCWERWIHGDYKRHKISVGRGCKNHCIYCSNTMLSIVSNNVYIRHRSIDSILKEINFIVKEYKEVQSIYFDDENILTDKEFFKQLCLELKKYNDKLEQKINFSLKINFTPNLLDEDSDIILLMKEANIDWIQFALESGSLEMRRRLNRPYYSNEQIIKFFGKLHEHKMHSMCYVMYCYPFENKKTYLETVECLKKCKPTIIEYSMLMPIENTALYNLLKKIKYPNVSIIDKYRFFTLKWRVYKTYKSYKEALFLAIEPFKIFSIIVNLYKKNERRIYKLKEYYKNKAKEEFNNKNYKEAIKYFNKIKIKDDNYWIYGDRAVAKMNIGCYKDALKDFDKVMELEPTYVYKQKRQECLSLLNKK